LYLFAVARRDKSDFLIYSEFENKLTVFELAVVSLVVVVVLRCCCGLAVVLFDVVVV
jgi:hypothetical protein